jgi:hypothetical protein
MRVPVKLPKLENINSERFLQNAFDPRYNEQLKRSTRIRRNIYLSLFLTGIACIIITIISGQILQMILSIALVTITLLISSMYDTRLFFLRNLTLRQDDEDGRSQEHQTAELP